MTSCHNNGENDVALDLDVAWGVETRIHKKWPKIKKCSHTRTKTTSGALVYMQLTNSHLVSGKNIPLVHPHPPSEILDPP